MEILFCDSTLDAGLRHLPSGYPQVNLAWMWGALLAATMAALAAPAHRPHFREDILKDTACAAARP